MKGELFYNRPTFPAQLDMAHPLTRGLVLCLVMNEDSPNNMRAWDSSLYQTHGSVIGARNSWGGKVFGGTNRITVDAPQQLNFTSGDFSMIAAIKRTGAAPGDWVCNGVATSGLRFRLSGGAKVHLITYQAGGNQETVGATVLVVLDRWYIAGITRSGASVTPYLDGVDNSDVAGTHTDPGSFTGATRIGIFGDDVSDPFVGEMAFLYIYNRALNANEQLKIGLNPYDMFLR